MKTTIGLQKWGINEVKEEMAHISMLGELSDLPPTQDNKLRMIGVMDSLNALYNRFIVHSGPKKEAYEVTVTATIFGDMTRNDTQTVMATSESEAKAAMIQHLINEFDIKIVAKKK